MHTVAITREQLHKLVDVVEKTEIDIIFNVLLKFIPQDFPANDEICAIKIAQQEITDEKIVSHSSIEW